jgi:hypothetical protein
MKTYPVENEGIITQCCICKKIEVIDENGKASFVKMDVPNDARVSDTYCSIECYKNWAAQEEANDNERNLEI